MSPLTTPDAREAALKTPPRKALAETVDLLAALTALPRMEDAAEVCVSKRKTAPPQRPWRLQAPVGSPLSAPSAKVAAAARAASEALVSIHRNGGAALLEAAMGSEAASALFKNSAGEALSSGERDAPALLLSAEEAVVWLTCLGKLRIAHNVSLAKKPLSAAPSRVGLRKHTPAGGVCGGDAGSFGGGASGLLQSCHGTQPLCIAPDSTRLRARAKKQALCRQPRGEAFLGGGARGQSRRRGQSSGPSLDDSRADCEEAAAGVQSARALPGGCSPSCHCFAAAFSRRGVFVSHSAKA